MNYLVKRKTNYIWNDLHSPDFKINVRVSQGSALSSILSALYLTPLLYILEKCLKNLKIPISILLFIDDGLIVVQNKSLDMSNTHLFCNYNILSKLLDNFGLVIEHAKTEIFHFNRSQGIFNPPPLDLFPIGGPTLRPKDTWKYLGFIFDRKLMFHQYIDHYSNKAILTVKCMKLLRNLSQGINPIQKRQLYRCCILPIALYGFQLWFYNKAPISYHMKILDKMQRRATIWILGAFKTSPTEGIEAITGIIPIKFHLQKLVRRSQIHPFKLPSNHIIRDLMDDAPNLFKKPNPHTVSSLMSRQKNIAKDYLIDSCNKAYGIFPSFSPLNQEFTPGFCLTDNFSDRFSFNLVNKKEKDNFLVQELDEIVLRIFSSPTRVFIATDGSIKNDITTSISHLYIANHPLVKTVHHTTFITSTEVELFAIRCGINQACIKENISKIIVITDSIHAVKKIFDSKSHPFQSHTTAILSKLRHFFNKNHENSIEFWECPSRLKWRFHKDIDKDSKSFNPIPSYPCKISWDYCKKSDSDDIINQWKMTFQALYGKGKHFMDLLDNNFNTIEPAYTKGGPWLQVFSHSNWLCARATRAITNHTPIREYWLRFFPNEDFKCPCDDYSIKSRRHILYECKRFNGCWNPRRDSLNHFIMFLIFNPNAFAFADN